MLLRHRYVVWLGYFRGGPKLCYLQGRHNTSNYVCAAAFAVQAKERGQRNMPQELNFLSQLTGSFSLGAAGNPTVAMIEAAYRHHVLDWRYINCEVTPERLGDAVRGARAMGWAGFNCSLPHKVAVIEHLDGLDESAAILRAVTCPGRRAHNYAFGNTHGTGFLTS